MQKRRSHRNFEVRALDSPGIKPFMGSAENEGKNWPPTSLPTPGFINGGRLSYDPIHHVLYVAKGMNGFWLTAQ
jgi:hypothetical protein